jgi:pimeloyl-ACP methyl ester carboxylesterase
VIDLSLPIAVAAALDDPAPGDRITVAAAGIPWSALTWGDPTAPPVLLLHGVTSNAACWWRVGPALAASGRHVTAIDQAGHGLTGNWQGHYRFRDNADDVAGFIRAAGLDRADLEVVGHSWGAMTAAALPAVGYRPASLVLLEPPTIPHATISAMAAEPGERTYATVDAALAALRPDHPDWAEGDLLAKAEALTQLDEAAARSVVLDNGDWDGGLADLADPAAAGIPVRVIRGDPAEGGLLPDAMLPAWEARIGPGHIHTIHGGPHSPQRTHPVETTAALLHALEDA